MVPMLTTLLVVSVPVCTVGMTEVPHMAKLDDSTFASSTASTSSVAGSTDDAVFVLLASDGLWDVATDDVRLTICAISFVPSGVVNPVLTRQDAVMFALEWLRLHLSDAELRASSLSADIEATAMLETRENSAVCICRFATCCCNSRRYS